MVAVRDGAAIALVTLSFCFAPKLCWSQAPAPPVSTSSPNNDDAANQPTAKVDVQPLARDPQIETRLQNILTATEWFDSPQVEVREGVVFLVGRTSEEQHKVWAGDLARRTQDVAAVVNKIEVRRSSLLDLGPARRELEGMWRNAVLALPNVLLSLIVIVFAWWAGSQTTGISRVVFARRISAPLLREVVARIIGVLVFLLGVYLVLRISGLTRLAVTVLGGTGLVGLVIGIAFRDITENFLASIFLSMQRPFQSGDLIEINAVLGYVQRLTTRTTIMMTLDGNHVQIPNSTVYKSAVRLKFIELTYGKELAESVQKYLRER